MRARQVIPWRSGDGPRPAGLALPPGPMPRRAGARPLKRWDYVGVFAPELSLCAAVAHVGPATVAWWAVWDRAARVAVERTRRTARRIEVTPRRVRVDDAGVRIDLALDPDAVEAVETVSPHGARHAWTRKRGGAPARGAVELAGRRIDVEAPAILDESAGYHARRTAWRWSAGAGTAVSGAAVAWNLVEGLHDDPRASERTVWVDGAAHPVGPASFAPGLDRVTTADGGDLRFRAEAVRAHRENLLLVVSEYAQPFGTVRGTLPHAGELATGHGVMERHAVRW